jgi:hypothetical protein
VHPYLGAHLEVKVRRYILCTIWGLYSYLFFKLLFESCTDLFINQHQLGADQVSNNDASSGLKDVSDSSGSSLSCLSGGTAAKSEYVPENALRSDQKHDTTEGAKAIPVGLGLGGLERKVS